MSWVRLTLSCRLVMCMTKLSSMDLTGVRKASGVFKKLSDIGHAALFGRLSVSVMQGVGSGQQGLPMGSNS